MPNPFLYKNSSISNNSVLPKYSLIVKNIFFKLLSLLKKFYFKQFSLVYKNSFISNNSVRSLNVKTVQFQAIQFIIGTQFSSIWPIRRTQSGATNLERSGPGSDGNERVLCIPQSSDITGISPSDCLVSYPQHSLVGSYPSAVKQSVYSTVPSDRAIINR